MEKERTRERLELPSVEEIMVMEEWSGRWETILKALLDALQQERTEIDPETIYAQQDPLPSYEHWTPAANAYHTLYNRKNGEKLSYRGDRLVERWLKTQDVHGRSDYSLRASYGETPSHFWLHYAALRYEPGSSEYRVAKHVRSIWEREGDEEAISQDLSVHWMEPAVLAEPYQADHVGYSHRTTSLQARLLGNQPVSVGVYRYEPFAAVYDSSGAVEEAARKRPPLYLAEAKWADRDTGVRIKERSPAGEITDINVGRDNRGKVSYSFSQEDDRRAAA